MSSTPKRKFSEYNFCSEPGSAVRKRVVLGINYQKLFHDEKVKLGLKIDETSIYIGLCWLLKQGKYWH
jgi:hypothetical protein